jgi:hypothetical protein
MPVTLATLTQEIGSIACDANNIYWTSNDDHLVMQMDFDGG